MGLLCMKKSPRRDCNLDPMMLSGLLQAGCTLQSILLMWCLESCRQAFLVCTGLCLCATVASATLYMRSRKLYRHRYCHVAPGS